MLGGAVVVWVGERSVPGGVRDWVDHMWGWVIEGMGIGFWKGTEAGCTYYLGAGEVVCHIAVPVSTISSFHFRRVFNSHSPQSRPSPHIENHFWIFNRREEQFVVKS